jgi:hypothetical protein
MVTGRFVVGAFESLRRRPPEKVRSWYLAKFEPELGPYTGHSDVWLRYYDEGDVRRWGEFIAEVLPGAVSRIAATHSE